MGKATIPQSALSRSQLPLHKGAFNSTLIEFILAPEGSIGEEAKSVKKRAALLHVLAFCFFDHNFGVLRGEQPLSRAPRPGSSGTFLVLFWSQKSTLIGQKPMIKGSHRKVVTPAGARFRLCFRLFSGSGRRRRGSARARRGRFRSHRRRRGKRTARGGR